VVIENRAGAGSIVGLEFTSAAAPVGYTWMLTSTGYGFIIQKAKVDLVNSFAPVAMIGTSDSALVVHPAFPPVNVKELVALARKRPGEINFASSGIGGFPHLNTELFMLLETPDMARRLDEQGVMISRRTTAEFAKLMESETAKWAKVIKAANVTGE